MACSRAPTTIRQLPFDIITEIFFLSLDETVNMDPNKPPLMFGTVCREWREMAWSTPKLWSELTITLTDTRAIPGKAVAHWIERVGSYPMILALLEHTIRLSPGIWRDIIATVVKRCRTWRGLSCLMNDLDLAHLVQSVERDGGAPMLLTAELRSTSLLQYLPLSFSAWPRVTSFLVAHPTRISSGPEHIHSLSSLAITIPGDFSDIYTLLERAPSLEDFSATLKSSDNGTFLSIGRVIEHSRLRVLRVSAPVMEFSSLDGLRLPSLQQLTLEVDRLTAFDHPFPSIASLVSRSASPLTHLNVNAGGKIAYKRGDIQFLRHFRNLRVLSPAIFADEDVLRALKCSSPKPDPERDTMPFLEDISFWPDGVFSPQLFADMVLSRWGPERRLKTVGLGCNRVLALLDERLGRCVDEGFILT